jgi:thymidylate synthase
MFKNYNYDTLSTPYQTQYYNILKNLINHPMKRVKTRNGVVYSRFFETMRVNLQKEYPLMDLKKIKFSNIFHELRWFLTGDTNIKYLVDNNCMIWVDDAYRYYNEKYKALCGGIEYSRAEFIDKVVSGDNLKILDDDYANKHDKKYYWFGDLDNIYSHQWTNFGELFVNQIDNVIHKLKTDPNCRRIIVTAHNPSDIEKGVVGLPSCHNMFQFYTSLIPIEKRIAIYNGENGGADSITTNKILDSIGIPKYYLSLWFNLRSNDMFLGNPYNIASYAMLNHIIGNTVNMIPLELCCSITDCHLYDDHVEPAMEWIERYEHNSDNNNYCKSKIKINKKINSLYDDMLLDNITLENYNPLPYIKARLLT